MTPSLTTAVLVTDAQDRPGLAAIRCLGAAGYRVTAAATKRLAPGLWSRDCSSRRVLSDPRDGVDRFISELEELLSRNHHDVLLPGRDETLYVISRYRHRIEPHVALGLPGHDVVLRAQNKERLATEARRVGLTAPDAQLCSSEDEAVDLARAYGFPVLVKPVQAVVELDGRLVRYPSRLATDESRVRQAQQHMGTCIVQRRQAGNVVSFAGVATDRGLLSSVLARYERTWPPTAGMASFSQTIIPPGALTEQVGALVEAIGWRGLFQLQLIEPDDGSLKAIDFNPRPFGSMGIARAAGAPLVTSWCAWLLGEDPQPVTGRPGVGYRWEDGDARRILWQLRSGDARGAVKAALPRQGTTHAYFQARDPLPLIVRGLELAGVRWRHARNR